jgi:hypothetical protein
MNVLNTTPIPLDAFDLDDDEAWDEWLEQND